MRLTHFKLFFLYKLRIITQYQLSTHLLRCKANPSMAKKKTVKKKTITKKKATKKVARKTHAKTKTKKKASPKPRPRKKRPTKTVAKPKQRVSPRTKTSSRSKKKVSRKTSRKSGERKPVTITLRKTVTSKRLQADVLRIIKEHKFKSKIRLKNTDHKRLYKASEAAITKFYSVLEPSIENLFLIKFAYTTNYGQGSATNRFSISMAKCKSEREVLLYLEDTIDYFLSLLEEYLTRSITNISVYAVSLQAYH